MRKTMEVLGKPMRYRTRRLLPGDTFVCSEREARMWERTKRAKETRGVACLPPPPPDLLAKFAPIDDLKALRAEYTAKMGKRPFPGWGADVLRQKIAG